MHIVMTHKNQAIRYKKTVTLHTHNKFHISNFRTNH